MNRLLPIILVVVTVVLLGVGAIANLVPAVRASRLNPMIALRTE